MTSSTLGEHSSELVSILGVVFFLLIGLIGVIYRNQNKKIDNLEWKIDNITITKFLTQEELDEHCKEYREMCPKGVIIESFSQKLETVSTNLNLKLEAISVNVNEIKESMDKIIGRQEVMREKTLPEMEKNISKEYLSIDRFDKYFEDLKTMIKEIKGGD